MTDITASPTAPEAAVGATRQVAPDPSRGPRMPRFEENLVRPASRLLWAGCLLAAAVLGAGLTLLIAGGFSIGLWVVLTFLAHLVIVRLAYTVTAGARQGADQMMRALVYGAFAIALVPLVSILWTVFREGLPTLFEPGFLSDSMKGVTGGFDRRRVQQDAPLVGGVYHAVVGTLIITGIATLISVPIGLLAAVYLVEYANGNRLSRALRFFVDVMTGIPSIVAGLFALALFQLMFGPGVKNGLAGAIALSTLMIPTVVRNSEEMLRIVPRELREASLALGVPKWRTILKIVLPTAASGLAAGITLAIARVIGETAPVLVATGVSQAMNFNPLDGPMNTLALYAYAMFTSPVSPGFTAPSYERGWGAVVILVFIVVLLNLLARLIAKVFAPKTGR